MSNKPQRAKKDQRQAAAAKVAEMRRQQAAAERKRRVLLGTVIAVVVLIIVGGAVYLQSTRDTATTSGSSTTPTGLTAKGGILRGVDSAPAKLVVYEDFMCPICGEFEKLSKAVLDQDVSKGTVQVEYRPISFLDRESNGTEYSTRAANALACVADNAGDDAALSMHNLLYANQPAENTDGLPDSQLVDLAVQAGASRSAVQTCIDNQTYKSWVANVTEQSSKDGVNGTPTAVLNGSALAIADTMNPTALQQAIDSAAS